MGGQTCSNVTEKEPNLGFGTKLPNSSVQNGKSILHQIQSFITQIHVIAKKTICKVSQMTRQMLRGILEIVTKFFHLFVGRFSDLLLYAFLLVTTAPRSQ